VTLYAGRVSIEKNLQLLRKLDLSGGRDLVVVGDGPYTETLRAAQPQARFTGFLTGADLQQAYADADIFVFPSKTDTFGNAVLEAMASGLPVIVTDVLGPKDFVRHGETGFIASGDEEFVEYHRRLVRDHDLRARMGRAARAYALTCSWDAIFEEQLIGNYRRVIEGDDRSNEF
jgi:glycosyltransferase involved in cell wall biosynthesis